MNSRRPRLISFSGIDGAGKSTQIAALCMRLRAAGQRVLLITFWDDAARLTRFRESAGHSLFRGERGVGTPEAPIHRRDKNVRSWAMTVVRLCLYSIDAVSLRLAVRKARRSGADVVICDRYIYDELANLNLGNPLHRIFVFLATKVVPKPHPAFLLDADPAAARARKPEYPLEFLHANRNSYLLLSDLAGMTVLDSMPSSAVERAVWKHASQGGTPDAAPAPSAWQGIEEKNETAPRAHIKAGTRGAIE